VAKLWSGSEASRKPSAAFVVIGHIDHGKSTLMGRLLLDTGAVQQRDIDKYEKQAAEMGKESFALAWVMDAREDEREHGVTIDIAQHNFSTSKADLTILDAPGHRDFVPNMIAGASMADFGVLVVDAKQLESGLKGQTTEHIQLARAIGLKRIIVAVNKMDTTGPAWDEAVFESVRDQVLSLLTGIGFASGDIKFVPCAGLTGQNVVKPVPTQDETSWVTGQHEPLITALEQFATITSTSLESIEQPFRLRINEVFASSGKTPDSVSGRINAGSVQVGDTIVLQPCGEEADVKRIEVADQNVDYAVAGQIATLQLRTSNPEFIDENVRKGDVASCISDVAAIVTDFTAKFTAVQALLPRPMELHIGPLKKGGVVTNPILATLDKDGNVVKKKARVVVPGQSARIKIEVEDGVTIDVGTSVVLRGTEGLLGYCVVESLGARIAPTTGA
jgi:elongation factor 1 alpha-like protein